jgi:hypothetical protein
VARFASKNNVNNGSCLGVADFSGHRRCPTSTVSGDFLHWAEGPVPAAGGSISNLWAELGNAMPPGKSATVSVLDITPPAGPQTVVLTCEVTSGHATCENTGAETILKGHYMLVRVNTTGPPTSWRVSFRY